MQKEMLIVDNLERRKNNICAGSLIAADASCYTSWNALILSGREGDNNVF